MLVVLTSPSAFSTPPNSSMAQVLRQIQDSGCPVGVTSNHAEPGWFASAFGGTDVAFIKRVGRQDGSIVADIATEFSMQPFDVIVIAGGSTDVQMAKNGGAVVIGAGWAGDMYTKSLGIQASNHRELLEVISLSASWKGHWWYDGSSANYSVKALADLSTYGKNQTQAVFASRLKSTVKNGGKELHSLLSITARSLLMDGFGDEKGLLWGVYPSSSSGNNDTDVLSDFTHRLRTTVSRVQHAKRGEPLFIRHTPSVKRSTGAGGDRTDPTNQIETLHLNPYYKRSLPGKHVVVVDDCTTYGVSFAVAAALLDKAGVGKVTGIALGKFGSQVRHQAIRIDSNPFKPVSKFTVGKRTPFTSNANMDVQNDLTKLI